VTAPVTHAARGWRTFATLALSATVTLVAVDLLLQRVSPVPPPLLEVEDGVAAWEAGQPDVLVLGSSLYKSNNLDNRSSIYSNAIFCSKRTTSITI